MLTITVCFNIACAWLWKEYYWFQYVLHPESFGATTDWYISEFQKTPCLDIVENMFDRGVSLPFAIYLADCCNEPDANYYVFAGLQKVFLDSEKDLPDSTFEAIALPYLERGAEKGSELCIKQLFDLYNNGVLVKPDSMLWKHYKSMYDSVQVVHIQDSLQRSVRRNKRMAPEDSAILTTKSNEVATKL